MNIGLISFNVPEIPAAGTSLGLTFASAFGANWLINKAASKLSASKINPFNKFYSVVGETISGNTELYQTQADEIEQLKSDIINLQRMKANQQPQQ